MERGSTLLPQCDHHLGEIIERLKQSRSTTMLSRAGKAMRYSARKTGWVCAVEAMMVDTAGGVIPIPQRPL